METMEHAAELTKAGHGQIVAAVAEAGVGKSRLFHEFKARNQFGWMVLEAFSVSHGKATAYLPVIELLHGYFRITSDDDQRTRREKVNGRIVTLYPALEIPAPTCLDCWGWSKGTIRSHGWMRKFAGAALRMRSSASFTARASISR